MALVSMKEMLQKAKQEGYAVGQYNINNLEFIPAFLEVAQEEQSPMIIAASDRMVDFLGGFKNVAGMVRTLYEELNITVPVALHLDHGQSIERCKKAVDAGFTSVMIDGSHHSIEENINMTKEVVSYAGKWNISVEGEVGSVGGQEDGLVGGIKYADVEECIRLVEETEIDALAAALGSVHGPYQGEPQLGFEQMEAISRKTELPLVLHGGTGIPAHQIQRAISLGHAKINVNTENIQAWTKAVKKKLMEDSNVYEPRLVLLPAIEAVKQSVTEKVREFGTSGKA
ncbi:2-deoxy-5-keto-D-gluconate 6-phosphate aldolase [Sinobaca qinghaiensis]|uniref:2-deoxy-5-keto-D-gluconate 6-phosphate aldolase n=1 Tax=Sinobaca qinghaiensis TaxID=342944 RepID=A0A419UWX1_9BACL|nr:class II fructose-1,6-bisphosphate aldolase [Sinobaca qinghaiensis]RKD69642.1 2-deoxy-5-keto-D-gluconate 6-phosphate aldolase [Sinobaca qinghaiensis]